MKEGRYIYSIIKTGEKRSFGEEIYTIPHQDIACVVSNAPMQDYSTMLKENLGHLLVRHQTTIEKIMKDHITIPMKFGTNVADDDEVLEVLKMGYSRFKKLLADMDGKIELDVACIWGDLNSIIKEVGEQDKEIKEFKAEIAERPPNEALQDRIKIGMMIKNALDKRKEKEEAHIIGFLKGAAIDFQKHQAMDDRMILNCAFLLEKVKEPDFDAALKKLDKEYDEKLNFKCVGPLPPYSFATCRLKKVKYSQLDEARKLLGLGDNVSLEKIKGSYHRLAQKNHPDKDLNNAHLKEEFEKITNAYKLLTSCYWGAGMSLEDNKRKDLIMVEIIRP